MLKKRISRLEEQVGDATTRWLESLSDAELQLLAGPISPKEEAFLASLSDEQLRYLSSGHATMGEYRELRTQWELENG